MPPRATGHFDVTITPQATADDAPVARMLLHKQFFGGLDAVAAGEMIAASEALTGAAAYVAIDRVTGTLDGRSGTFILAHRGTMTSAGQQLSIIVVPGSGTGQLTGLSGELAIDIVEKKHYYTLDYSLPSD